LIIITSIALAFENPLNDPDGITTFILSMIDYVTTVFFVIEVLMKGFGLGPRNYFKDPWNIMDFIIVVASLVAFMPI
jgi:L-cystine uptake protein TcyP (sodium:dicarboxylate symporter family)